MGIVEGSAHKTDDMEVVTEKTQRMLKWEREHLVDNEKKNKIRCRWPLRKCEMLPLPRSKHFYLVVDDMESLTELIEVAKQLANHPDAVKTEVESMTGLEALYTEGYEFQNKRVRKKTSPSDPQPSGSRVNQNHENSLKNGKRRKEQDVKTKISKVVEGKQNELTEPMPDLEKLASLGRMANVPLTISNVKSSEVPSVIGLTTISPVKIQLDSPSKSKENDPVTISKVRSSEEASVIDLTISPLETQSNPPSKPEFSLDNTLINNNSRIIASVKTTRKSSESSEAIIKLLHNKSVTISNVKSDCAVTKTAMSSSSVGEGTEDDGVIFISSDDESRAVKKLNDAVTLKKIPPTPQKPASEVSVKPYVKVKSTESLMERPPGQPIQYPRKLRPTIPEMVPSSPKAQSSTLNTKPRASPVNYRTPSRSSNKYFYLQLRPSMRAPRSIVMAPHMSSTPRQRGPVGQRRPRIPTSQTLFNQTTKMSTAEGILESGSGGYLARLPDGGIVSMSPTMIGELRQKNNGTLPVKVTIPLIKKKTLS